MTREDFRNLMARLLKGEAPKTSAPAPQEQPKPKRQRFPPEIERSIRIGEMLRDGEMPSWQRRVHEDLQEVYDHLGYRRGQDY
jgi:hypothetical protein